MGWFRCDKCKRDYFDTHTFTACPYCWDEALRSRTPTVPTVPTAPVKKETP